MSQVTAFPTRLLVRQVKRQISLRFRAVPSDSLQEPLLVAKDAERLQADSKNTDQTARMRRLI